MSATRRRWFSTPYADYVDIATGEFLRAIGFGETFMAGAFDFQLVKQATQWTAAARYDQVLEIGIRAEHMGNTSFTLAAEFRVAGHERVIVTAETVYVLVEAHSLRKTPLPADLRAALAHEA